MLKIVISNNSDVYRLLGQPAFKRAVRSFSVALGVGDFLNYAEEDENTLAIIDTELADGSGYQVLEVLRARQKQHV